MDQCILECGFREEWRTGREEEILQRIESHVGFRSQQHISTSDDTRAIRTYLKTSVSSLIENMSLAYTRKSSIVKKEEEMEWKQQVSFTLLCVYILL